MEVTLLNACIFFHNAGLLSGTVSDKPVRYPHRLTHVEKESTETYETEWRYASP